MVKLGPPLCSSAITWETLRSSKLQVAGSLIVFKSVPSGLQIVTVVPMFACSPDYRPAHTRKPPVSERLRGRSGKVTASEQIRTELNVPAVMQVTLN